MISDGSSKVCDLCGQADFESISDTDRRGEKLITDLCLTCGLVSHHEIPSEEELTSFYATEYRVSYKSERTPSSRRITRAWKNGKRIAKQLSPFLMRDSEILEVGAGVGCTVRALCELGYKATGIEPNHGFQEYASEALGVEVSRNALESLEAVGVYQSILLVHVIEHFRSPKAALKKIHELLKPQGLLYIECPNLSAPFATWNRLFHYAHIHNFTPETLRCLAERSGFEVITDFQSSAHPNLQMLLRKTEQPRCLVLPIDAAEHTLRMARRYGIVGYHMRTEYIRRRILQLSNYAIEHLVAKKTAKWLLKTTDTSIKDAA